MARKVFIFTSDIARCSLVLHLAINYYLLCTYNFVALLVVEVLKEY
jgi:hypothetical protein